MLVKNSKKDSKKGDKQMKNWTGPFRIHEDLGKGTYRLCDKDDCSQVKAQLVNITRLKLYNSRPVVKVGNITIAIVLLHLINLLCIISSTEADGK